MYPQISSDLPESSMGHASWIPIWSCSRWGLPCRDVLPRTRCALTAPFHPYRLPVNRKRRRSSLCCTCRRLAPPRHYLALCPMEPGLSSPPLQEQRLSGELYGAKDTSKTVISKQNYATTHELFTIQSSLIHYLLFDSGDFSRQRARLFN